ncbi:YceI family protein [Frateuria hangzhouensis]|uniref:YceI family protein n=1 Tax=Frateuria hangzhouensis TaxID=2995589 RepID=UPI002260BF60|nr:YceI family protein [Frateuria sp. STR12]MCX7514456.1 YceI family protein [Frateuria sp. STR12]
MRALKILALAGLFAAASAAQAAPVTYKLDPGHTMVLFSWSHFGFSHPTAELGLGQGTLVFDPDHPEQATVEVTLPLADLDTHVPALDEHLAKPDFLDTAKYPQVTYKSTRVEPLGKDHFRITGDLTVHGVTRPVVLDATLNRIGKHPMSGKPSIGFNATGTLRRSDFGVSMYTPNVSDEITLHITTEGSAK